jgi:hypothetical protein
VISYHTQQGADADALPRSRPGRLAPPAEAFEKLECVGVVRVAAALLCRELLEPLEDPWSERVG